MSWYFSLLHLQSIKVPIPKNEFADFRRNFILYIEYHRILKFRYCVMTVENGSHPILKQSSALNWLKSDPAIIYPIFDREREKLNFLCGLLSPRHFLSKTLISFKQPSFERNISRKNMCWLFWTFPMCVCENHLVTCTEETFARKITAMTIHNVFLWLLLVKCNSLREKYCLKESVAEPGIWHFQPEA